MQRDTYTTTTTKPPPKNHTRRKTSGRQATTLDGDATTTNGRVGQSTRNGDTSKQCECTVCKTKFWPTRRAKYCSAACRQKAYRQRKADTPSPTRRHCQHCRTAFTPRHKRHKFCSVSCRTMSHRKRRKAAVKTYATSMAVSQDKAQDIADMAGIGALQAALEVDGYSYSHRLRQWRR